MTLYNIGAIIYGKEGGDGEVECKDEERDRKREVAEEEKLRPESLPRNSIGLGRSLCIVSQSPIKRIVWNQSLIFVSPCPL